MTDECDAVLPLGNSHLSPSVWFGGGRVSEVETIRSPLMGQELQHPSSSSFWRAT